MLFKLPHLTFLDSRSVTETERKESRRVGKFMKVVRPSDEEVRNRNIQCYKIVFILFSRYPRTGVGLL